MHLMQMLGREDTVNHLEHGRYVLTTARTELSATQARFLVHAAMALVVDVGRLAHYSSGVVIAHTHRRACGS